MCVFLYIHKDKCFCCASVCFFGTMEYNLKGSLVPSHQHTSSGFDTRNWSFGYFKITTANRKYIHKQPKRQKWQQC